jgi:hypothetical protein
MTKPNLPSVLGNTIMPHMSARARTAIMDEVFQKTGGSDKMAEWVQKNDDNYGKFLQMWAKGAMRPASIENAQAQTLEEMLERLDAGEHAKVINADQPEQP